MNTLNDSFVEFNMFCDGDPKRHITILHQNIRSLRENFSSFIFYLNQISHKPDIIVLTEIWVSDFEVPMFKIQNYKPFSIVMKIFVQEELLFMLLKDFQLYPLLK